ncbi:hypothetical protein PT974_08966 [Cladobotryum mycophilum]|uniref:Methyl-CpG-binding domain-containing protein 4 n=1 Tax=Cladobotryum mycophilum TaxID=491253 RepID=A0ABR0SEX2_9HYPO
MVTRFGDNLLSVFDVWEDSREFLISLIESRAAPDEQVKSLFDQSLIGGVEDWHYLIECAESIRQANTPRLHELDGRDVLTFVWGILNKPNDSSSSKQDWEETDRLISLARGLEKDIEIRPPLSPAEKRQDRIQWKTTKPVAPISQKVLQQQETDRKADITCISSINNVQALGILTPVDCSSGHCESTGLHYGTQIKKESILKKQSTESPYFLQLIPEKKGILRVRPPPGTVSCVPFPSLNSPSFGLIQEKVAHEPFWLLIAITFLIKTNGKLAIPTFYKLKQRFPTLPDLIDPGNEEELLGMIQHLGLSRVRLGYIHRYARAFLEQPPKAGVRYRVRNYDRRVASPPRELSSDSGDEALLTPDATEDLEAWEIGHMTQGKYALDSWRIFCRDQLLGRVEDWNGKGREPEFQPEWMRTRPNDKELRAYLRWMWMREGWEWDPLTGERTVLRDEMRRAVNEGRVEYDETGALRILEAPTGGAAMMPGE